MNNEETVNRVVEGEINIVIDAIEAASDDNEQTPQNRSHVHRMSTEASTTSDITLKFDHSSNTTSNDPTARTGYEDDDDQSSELPSDSTATPTASPVTSSPFALAARVNSNNNRNSIGAHYLPLANIRASTSSSSYFMPSMSSTTTTTDDEEGSTTTSTDPSSTLAAEKQHHARRGSPQLRLDTTLIVDLADPNTKEPNEHPMSTGVESLSPTSTTEPNSPTPLLKEKERPPPFQLQLSADLKFSGLSSASALSSSLIKLLPGDIIYEVFTYVGNTHRELQTLAAVCRHWKTISERDLLWINEYQLCKEALRCYLASLGAANLKKIGIKPKSAACDFYDVIAMPPPNDSSVGGGTGTLKRALIKAKKRKRRWRTKLERAHKREVQVHKIYQWMHQNEKIVCWSLGILSFITLCIFTLSMFTGSFVPAKYWRVMYSFAFIPLWISFFFWNCIFLYFSIQGLFEKEV
eukprot:GEZU01032753.1.p1 GENE.GEZU01032753.1~~GEZU01032753.1.p1  ORF type:complete len:465 (+),score=104.26 GEZU01032753.1:69-1463(+)